MKVIFGILVVVTLLIEVADIALGGGGRLK